MNIQVRKDKTSTLTLTQTIFRFICTCIQVILDLVLHTWDSKWTVSAKKRQEISNKKIHSNTIKPPKQWLWNQHCNLVYASIFF